MRKFVPLTTIAVAGLVVISVPTGCHTAETRVTRETAFDFYRSYPRLTREPRAVDSMLFTLCTAAIPPPSTETRGNELVPRYGTVNPNGPHEGFHVHVYANPIAVDSISQRKPAFPEGSVIVKEKLNVGGAVLAVGGMIKRAAGRFPESGDWEYFYAAKGGEFTNGPMPSCYTCHSRVAAQDYVFQRWR